MIRVYATSREDGCGDSNVGLQVEEPLHRSFGVFPPVEHPQGGSVQHVRNDKARVRLARQACRSGSVFKAAGGEMCVGQAEVRNVNQGIERAKANRAIGMLDRDRFVAHPRMYDRTEAERKRRRTGERERPVECAERCFVFSASRRNDKASNRERDRIVAALRHRMAGMVQGGVARFLL